MAVYSQGTLKSCRESSFKYQGPQVRLYRLAGGQSRATRSEGRAAGRQGGSGLNEADPEEWPGKQRGSGSGLRSSKNRGADAPGQRHCRTPAAPAGFLPSYFIF